MRLKQKANLMFNTTNKRTPLYLQQQMFSPRENVDNQRDSQDKLNVPKPRTDHMKRSLTFSYSGAFLWNRLPHFKTGLNYYLNDNIDLTPTRQSGRTV